jgi:hypothetical protein
MLCIAANQIAGVAPNRAFDLGSGARVFAFERSHLEVLFLQHGAEVVIRRISC